MQEKEKKKKNYPTVEECLDPELQESLEKMSRTSSSTSKALISKPNPES